MKKNCLSISGLLLAASAGTVITPAVTAGMPAPSVEQWAPYPKIEPGMKRQVIFLPEKPNEADYRVELLIGKTMEVDCNRHITGVPLKTHALKGWGYDYLVVGELFAPASTRMTCPDRTLT